MKKLLLTLSASLLFFCGFSQGITFEKGTLNEILSKAKSENKLVFIDVFTEWCGPCKIVSAEVFPNQKLGKLYNQKFISLKIDAEKGEGIEFAKKYKVEGYPTMLFLDSDGKVIQRLLGSKSIDFLIKEVANIETYLKEGSPESFGERFKAGERDPKFLLKYYDLCSNEQRQDVLIAYLMALPDDQLFSTENKYFDEIKKYDSKLFTRLIDGLASRQSKDEVFNFKVTFPVQNLLSGFFDQSINEGNLKMFNEILGLKKKAILLNNSIDPDYLLMTGRGLFFASDEFVKLKYTMKNSKEYGKSSVEIKNYMENFMVEYPQDSLQKRSISTLLIYPKETLAIFIRQLISVNSYSSLFLLDCTDLYWRKSKTSKALIADCTKWCNYMFAINPLNYEVAIKAANILYRMDKSKEAIAMLQEAIDYQVKYNLTGESFVESLNELIDDIKNKK